MILKREKINLYKARNLLNGITKELDMNPYKTIYLVYFNQILIKRYRPNYSGGMYLNDITVGTYSICFTTFYSYVCSVYTPDDVIKAIEKV